MDLKDLLSLQEPSYKGTHNPRNRIQAGNPRAAFQSSTLLLRGPSAEGNGRPCYAGYGESRDTPQLFLPQSSLASVRRKPPKSQNPKAGIL